MCKKPGFIVGIIIFLKNRFNKPDLCQHTVMLLSQLKLAAQCIIHKKGGLKTGCGRNGK